MEPTIAYSMLKSISLLTNATRVLGAKCIIGLTVNAEHCREDLASTAVATALTSLTGYERAFCVAKATLKRGSKHLGSTPIRAASCVRSTEPIACPKPRKVKLQMVQLNPGDEISSAYYQAHRRAGRTKRYGNAGSVQCAREKLSRVV